MAIHPSRSDRPGRPPSGSGWLWLLLSLLVLLGTPAVLAGAVEGQRRPPVVVGYNRDFPPFEFQDASGRPSGYDIDLIRAAAAEVDLPLTFKAGTWEDIRNDVIAGRVDVVPGMLYSEARAELVDFSAPHLLIHYSIFLRRDSRGVAALADLKGRRVLVEAGSRMQEFLRLQGFGAELVQVASEPEALRLLAAGDGSAAAVLPRLQGLEMIRTLGLRNVQPLAGTVFSEDLCFAVAKGRGRLRGTLDSGVAILHRSGGYRRIYDRWLGPLDPAQVPARVLRFLGLLALGASGLAILVLAWSWVLRRQVHQRTQALRASQEAIAASHRKLQAIFNSTNDAIFIHDLASGAILEVNDRATELYGYPRAAFVDLDVATLSSGAPPFTQERALERIRAAAAGAPQVFEWQARAASGQLFWVEVNMRRADLEQQGRLVVAVRDITDRKRAESEHLELSAQLNQSQKLESLGSLAGGVAHDMNNVLGAILGLASANLEQHPPGSAARQAFGTIAKAAVRGGKLVKGLLGFARQSPAEQRELDMNAVLLEEIHLLERTTLASVHLDLELAPDLRPILGDPGALTHAFMNLCVNAVDAMAGSGRLLLRTRNLDSDWIEVLVEDSGCGMSSAVLAKAMDPFFTTKALGKGTGLGLSMVYSTVKAHGGRLDIQSEPGHGTRVRASFPVCASAPSLALAAAGAVPDCPRSGLEVLLVDDDELVQAAVGSMLELLGHRVTLAPSGEAALAAIEGGYLPERVILDMNMPGIGGAGTLPRLRALLPSVPVLIATGRPDQTVLDLMAAYPLVTLLPKPFGVEDLIPHLR
jgi:two-component system sensor histidine kinase EvgS